MIKENIFTLILLEYYLCWFTKKKKDHSIMSQDREPGTIWTKLQMRQD